MKVQERERKERELIAPQVCSRPGVMGYPAGAQLRPLARLGPMRKANHRPLPRRGGTEPRPCIAQLFTGLVILPRLLQRLDVLQRLPRPICCQCDPFDLAGEREGRLVIGGG